MFTQTFVFLSTFGNIDSRLISLRTKTKSPAGGSSSALFIAVLNGRNTFGVFLAGSPLIGAFLLNTRQGIKCNFSIESFNFYTVEAMVVKDTFIEVRCCLITFFG
jgi:hypothetical protein